MSCSYHELAFKKTYSDRFPWLLGHDDYVSLWILTQWQCVVYWCRWWQLHHLEGRKYHNHLADVADITRLVAVDIHSVLIADLLQRELLHLGVILTGIIEHILVAFRIRSQLPYADLVTPLFVVFIHGYQVVRCFVECPLFRIEDEDSTTLILLQGHVVGWM